MRRHQIRVVVGFLGIDVVAARGLDADHLIAEPVQRQAECAVGHMRIVLRLAPSDQSPPVRTASGSLAKAFR
jgi:hypothetical protein